MIFLSSSHYYFIISLSPHSKPKFFAQIDSDPRWRELMQAKLTAFEQNKTWTLSSLPLEKRVIKKENEYIKLNTASDGTIKRYKAYLLADSYT